MNSRPLKKKQVRKKVQKNIILLDWVSLESFRKTQGLNNGVYPIYQIGFLQEVLMVDVERILFEDMVEEEILRW